jgi:inner membrane protein
LDNITHSFTAFFLSRAGLNRLTPQATAILLLSANAPDIDLVTLAGGSLNYFHYHRHLTHSLIFAPVLAAAVLGIVRIAGRKAFPLFPAFLVSLIGVASHLCLDWTNQYGIRLLLPFSGEWLHGDLINLFDVWLLTVFTFCLLAPVVSGLVGGEIGSPKPKRFPGRGFAWVALGFLALYDGGRWVLHSRALAILDSRIYDGAAPLRVAAFPYGSNPLEWRGIAETETAYQVFLIPVLQPPQTPEPRAIFKAEPSPAIDVANRTEEFRVFRDFAIYPLWQVIPAEAPDGAVRVVLSDLRFPFSSSAVVDRSNAVRSAVFSYSR